jgi:hypothetical protein
MAFSLEPHEQNRNNYINYGNVVPLEMENLQPINSSERKEQLLQKYMHWKELPEYNELNFSYGKVDNNLLRKPKILKQLYICLHAYNELLKGFVKTHRNHTGQLSKKANMNFDELFQDELQMCVARLYEYPRLHIHSIYKNPEAIDSLLEDMQNDYNEYQILSEKRRNETINLFSTINNKLLRASLKRKNRNNSNNSGNSENSEPNYVSRHKRMTLPGAAFGQRKTQRRSKK